MNHMLRRSLLTATVIATAGLAPLALSHFDDKEPLQSFRQSYFALLASNFGPLGAMVKGEAPWDEARVRAY
ncbi:MAG: cytochrome c, partial [Parahaliea sp.]